MNEEHENQSALSLERDFVFSFFVKKGTIDDEGMYYEFENVNIRDKDE